MFKDNKDGQTNFCTEHVWIYPADSKRKACEVCGLRAPLKDKKMAVEPQLLGIIADIADEVFKIRFRESSDIRGERGAKDWYDSIITRLNELKK